MFKWWLLKAIPFGDPSKPIVMPYIFCCHLSHFNSTVALFFNKTLLRNSCSIRIYFHLVVIKTSPYFRLYKLWKLCLPKHCRPRPSKAEESHKGCWSDSSPLSTKKLFHKSIQWFVVNPTKSLINRLSKDNKVWVLFRDFRGKSFLF